VGRIYAKGERKQSSNGKVEEARSHLTQLPEKRSVRNKSEPVGKTSEKVIKNVARFVPIKVQRSGGKSEGWRIRNGKFQALSKIILNFLYTF